MKRLFFICIMFLFLLVGCSLGENNQDSDENSEKNSKAKATDKMKSFKMGQVVEADGVDIKVVKAEFINSHDEFNAPKNGKALRVYIKFKNNNDDQVLIDNTDFGMKVNNENYEEWYGSDDMHEGFSHQLNHNNTASGYITYDVPDSDNYTLELDAIPNFNKVRAKWVINKSDISNSNDNNSTSGNSSASEEHTSTNDSDDSTTDDNSTDTEEDEGVTYPASMYNDLVDEYNSLTDGEKMNHVSKDVLEIEYDQLEARVEALYEKEEEKYEKQAAKEEAEAEQEEAEYEKQQAKEEEEFEKEQAKEDAEYEKQQAEEDAEAEQEEKAEEEAESTESSSEAEDANSEDNAA